MTFRFKTIGGLLLIAVLGSATALVFQRPTTAPTTAQEAAVAGAPLGGGTRGRIVPLVVDEQAPLAFVPAAAAAASDGWAPRNRLQSLPTIRASAQDDAAAPEMSPAFPRPDELSASPPAELPRAEQRGAEAELAPVDEGQVFAPIPPPVIAAKPVIAEPLRHKIVDGDTLPDLAQRYLGDAQRASEIYEQNRQQLDSPELLPLGVEILINP